MKLKELREIVNRVYDINPEKNGEIKVVIPDMDRTQYGGTQYVEIDDARNGFDWDSGKFFLIPEYRISVKVEN